MAWIKRNLYFFIGSVAALLLMGLAGYFLYSKWSLNNEYFDKLNSTSEELKGLNNKNPHPGTKEINNIKLAQEQREQLRQFLKKARESYTPIAPIPNVPKMSDQDFSTALIQTIVDLQRDATNTGIALPADTAGSDYAFSFKAQRIRISFAKGTTDLLSVQLGEVKSLCDILFAAKINSLDNIRRARVGKDDDSGPQTDYLTEVTVTNETALLTQYEVTFRSFSAELGAVLAGFAGSPHAWVVKTINTELAPANSTASAPDLAAAAYAPPAYPAMDAAGMMRQRYGMMGGMQGMPGGYGRGGYPAPYPVAAQPPPQPVAAPVNRGGLPTVLDEKLLKVTMNVILVKLVPGK